MRKIIIALFLIVIFVGILSALYLLNKPPKQISQVEKEAAIAKILGRKPNLTDNTKTGDTQFKGQYISFIYPAAATPQKQLLNGEEIPYTGLELFIFTLENPRITVHAEVTNAPQSVTNLTDYPGVRLRQIQSNLYTESNLEIQNSKGLVFSMQNQAGFEKTAFFFLNNKIYTLSVQSPDSKAVEDLFDKIIASFKFL